MAKGEAFSSDQLEPYLEIFVKKVVNSISFEIESQDDLKKAMTEWKADSSKTPSSMEGILSLTIASKLELTLSIKIFTLFNSQAGT